MDSTASTMDLNLDDVSTVGSYTPLATPETAAVRAPTADDSQQFYSASGTGNDVWGGNFNFDAAPGDHHNSYGLTTANDTTGYGMDSSAAVDEDEDEYDDFGNLIPKKKKDQGPSIWDMPMDDATPTAEIEKKTEPEEVAIATYQPKTYEKVSNRVHSVTKEPGIPLESSTVIPQALRVLRRHSLFQEMYWNDFYRLCTSSGLVRAAKLPKGTVLMEQGVSVTRNGCGEFCFFLVRGRVSVLKDGVEMATLKDEAAFGEEAVMYRQPAPTSLVAASTLDVWIVPPDTYKQLAHRKRLAARRAYRL